jgi:hypothetical protein
MTSGVRILMVSLGLRASMMLAACASGSRSAGTTSSTTTPATVPTAPPVSDGCVVQEVLVVVSGAKLLLAGPGARQACDALTGGKAGGTWKYTVPTAQDREVCAASTPSGATARVLGDYKSEVTGDLCGRM